MRCNVYSVSAASAGGAAENLKVNQKPGERVPGLFLRPYKPASAARIGDSYLHPATPENATHASQGPDTGSGCSYSAGAAIHNILE